jgi:hypothetical protein
MSTFRILSKRNTNSILVRPPSNKQLLESVISKFGLLESNKPIRILIKNKKAANGSIASKDIVLNGVETMTLQQILSLNNQNN